MNILHVLQKIMNTNENKSFLREIPSGVLGIITFVLSTIFMFAVGYPLVEHFGDNIGDWITYLSTGILISVACYFICRTYPKSIWYIPIICNIMGVLAAISEPQFWVSSMWMPFSIGWFLSLIGAFSGTWIGYRAILKNE